MFPNIKRIYVFITLLSVILISGQSLLFEPGSFRNSNNMGIGVNSEPSHVDVPDQNEKTSGSESPNYNTRVQNGRNSRNIEYYTDWIIDNETSVSSKTIYISGNLTISSTGFLTIQNSTIIFRSKSNTTRGLIVEPGGKLKTGFPLTDETLAEILKPCLIAAENNTSFFIHARANSFINIGFTDIDFGGSDNNDTTKINGINPSEILVESSESYISDTRIKNSNYGLVYNNSVNGKIERLQIENTFQNGISIYNSSNLEISEIQLTGFKTALTVKDSSNIKIIRSVLDSNDHALKIINSSRDHFDPLSSPKISEYDWAHPEPEVISLLNSSITGNKYGISSFVSTLYLSNNSIRNNLNGMIFNFSTVLARNDSLTESDSIKLENNSIIEIYDLNPLPETTSDFWNVFSIDLFSELHVFNMVMIYLKIPPDQTFPFKGNVTLFGINNWIILSEKIKPEPFSFIVEPIGYDMGHFVTYLVWKPPLRIEFYDNGSYLNETFDVLTNFSFTFELGYNSGPELKLGKVNPEKGDTKTHFVFEVQYWDFDGDQPLYVKLHFDGNSYTMERSKFEGTPKTGMLYRMEFFNLDVGEHSFYFEADDGRNFPNSIVIFRNSTNLSIESIPSTESPEEESDFMFLFLTICFVMVFVFVIFVIAMNIIVQKKLKKSGGVLPGTLPEDMAKTEESSETIICSECGAEISADESRCPKCGEVFEGDEYQCPKCDKIVPEEAIKCPFCGNEFLFMENGEESSDGKVAGAAEKEEKLFDEKFYCSECGAVVEEGMFECPGCGEKFEDEIEDAEHGKPGTGKKSTRRKKNAGDDQTFICSVCGASVKESSNRCPKCKTEFE